MISRLRGTVWESKPLQLVVDVNGVGYAVSIPLTQGLPQTGQKVDLYTYAVYREDSATLYGFLAEEERNFFALLIDKVSGIGPKTALAMLTHLPVNRLQAAIESGDLNTLKATPGIGKKTAERLLLELKGQVNLGGGTAAQTGAIGDAIAALISLGYSQAEAQKAILKVSSNCPGANANELIKIALKDTARASL